MDTTTMMIIFTLGVLVLLAIVAGIASYSIYSNGKKTQDALMIQIEAAKAKKNNHIINMPYKDLLGIVDNLVNFYTKNAVMDFSLSTKNDTELSVVLDDILINICTDVKMSVSKDLHEAILFYVSDAYFNKYIKNTARLLLILEIKRAGRTIETTPTQENVEKK